LAMSWRYCTHFSTSPYLKKKERLRTFGLVNLCSILVKKNKKK
jgi:hypothetical protein